MPPRALTGASWWAIADQRVPTPSRTATSTALRREPPRSGRGTERRAMAVSARIEVVSPAPVGADSGHTNSLAARGRRPRPPLTPAATGRCRSVVGGRSAPQIGAGRKVAFPPPRPRPAAAAAPAALGGRAARARAWRAARQASRSNRKPRNPPAAFAPAAVPCGIAGRSADEVTDTRNSLYYSDTGGVVACRRPSA